MDPTNAHALPPLHAYSLTRLLVAADRRARLFSISCSGPCARLRGHSTGALSNAAPASTHSYSPLSGIKRQRRVGGLAGMIGTTHSRVGFFLNSFGTLGLIENSRKLHD